MISEAFLGFLSENGVVRELGFSINCNVFTVQKSSQGAYDPALITQSDTKKRTV